MPNSISSAVLVRYFDGVATPEEQAAMEAWLGGDPARQAAVAAWQAVWRADAERLSGPYEAEAAWTRLSERVGLLTLVHDERPVPLGRPVPPRAKLVRWAVAAVVVLVAGAGAWRVLNWHEPEHASRVPAMREYATPRGQRGIVRLPDGTEVMLNVASRLTVPATFGVARQPRAVELEGQAYFTVVHDGTRPFVVHTAHSVTRDIGTRFDVRAYAGDLEERVVVTEGEVVVRGDSRAGEVPLRKGQVATVTQLGQVTLVRGAGADQEPAWTRGRLLLDGVTLAEAARRLSRWYDLDVRVIGDGLAQRSVVGSYRDEPVAQVLGIIAAAVGARYELRGPSVTFFPRDGSR